MTGQQEVLKLTNDEFKRLQVKFPGADPIKLHGIAEMYVFDICLAETMIIKQEIMESI